MLEPYVYADDGVTLIPFSQVSPEYLRAVAAGRFKFCPDGSPGDEEGIGRAIAGAMLRERGL